MSIFEMFVFPKAEIGPRKYIFSPNLIIAKIIIIPIIISNPSDYGKRQMQIRSWKFIKISMNKYKLFEDEK